MFGDADPFEFFLADRLGLTLHEVRGMPNHEVEEWRAFHHYRRAMEDFEARRHG